MLAAELSLSKPSRFWRLLCNLRIRQLLIMVLGNLSLIAILAIGWNAFQVYYQYDEAEQLFGSNEIGQQALDLNANLARERGYTAIQLAKRSAHSPQSSEHLSQLRIATDNALSRLNNRLEQNSSLSTSTRIYRQLGTMTERLLDNRQLADREMQRVGPGISYADWIEKLDQRIEEVAIINRIVMSPRRDEDDVVRYGVFIMESFFTLSENAGRERALVSAVIALQRPFREEEYRLLETYRHTHELTQHRLNEILSFLPATTQIIQAQSLYREIYDQHYQKLRSSVLQQSLSGQSYSVTATEWFEQSTRAVDAILNLSDAVKQHLNDDIDITKNRARSTVIALFVTMLLVVSVFLFSFMLIYRRILMPLRELESSVNTIGMGDFSHTIKIMAQDEFGDLAESFEMMRNFLLIDREHRQSVENELRKLSMAIEQSVSSIVITDIEGITEYVNPQFYRTTGYSAEEVIGAKFNMLDSGEMALSTFAGLWSAIKGGRVWEGELRNKKKSGDLFWDQVSISPVRDKRGNITHFIGIQHDITERKEMEQKLNFMAYHDELTELPNRALLRDRYEQKVRLYRRENKKMALLIMDLDRFNLTNDSLGHRVGDQLLIDMAKKLKEISRNGDTLARYGGDEFVILAGGISSIDDLIDIAKRIVEVIARPVNIEGHNLHASISVGISIWPDDGQDMDTLLRNSDTAMYQAKQLGGGRFQFFTEDLNQQTHKRLEMENALHDAILYNQFELYYQPQVDLASGRIVGAEALIRWNHPELGLVSPLDFVSLAEETNLIIPIGDWVLETACAQAALWKQNSNLDLLMAVNVSVRQLDDEGFVDRLISIVEQSGIPYRNLEVEITESSVMHQPDKMIEILTRITSLGIQLALDDFGTGYSSLSYLRRFPFDKLKIDRSFIKDITSNPEDAAITNSIVEMAHNLNMIVIAEGVETDKQVNFLREGGCDEIQGYLISRPVQQGSLMFC